MNIVPTAEPSHPTERGRPTALRLSCLVAVMAALSLSACAGAPTVSAAANVDQPNDPAERTNRAIFAGNQFVDRNLLKTVAHGYQDYVPGQVRKRVGNFAGNLGEPAVAINDVLQGNLGRAWTTSRRFVVNTTVGGLGLFDAATDWGLPHHTADFGQTLGVWGAGPGPVVELPLLGSSNVRDTAGAVVGILTNPFSAAGGAVSTVASVGSGLGLVDRRAGLLPTTDQLEHDSLDYYATLRTIAAQRRAALVEQGRGRDSTPQPLPVAEPLPGAPYLAVHGRGF